MKAVLEHDIIIHITEQGDTEIGNIPADKKGVGLERLRWTGTEIVDLADLTEMWIRHLGHDFFEFHAIPVPDAQRVSVSYGDRHRLVMNDGLLRLKTDEEIEAEGKTVLINLFKAELWRKQKASIGSLEEQLANAYKLIYLLLYYAKTGNQQINDFIDEILPEIKDTFPLIRIKDEIKQAVQDMNVFMKKYYQDLDQIP